ncbi:MAG TPA: GrpB family protein [Thermoplasmata archaeon]|nr:GrpB family protein [Thermoplasmata archaeon]
MSRVQLVAYDPSWPSQFESLRSRIVQALPDARVEHIGSTAVPGCAAKPIIDISVGLAPGSSVRDATFRAAGLTFRSLQPYSLVFAIDHPDGNRWANVHVRYQGSESELNDLRLRDFLRVHAEAVRAYVEAKTSAATASVDGREYTRTKAPFIERLRGEVRRWAEATGWSPS